MTAKFSLTKLRHKIDKIDTKIIKLLENRLDLVQLLAPHKKKLTDKKREQEILQRIKSDYIQEIYKTIFKISKKMMKT